MNPEAPGPESRGGWKNANESHDGHIHHRQSRRHEGSAGGSRGPGTKSREPCSHNTATQQRRLLLECLSVCSLLISGWSRASPDASVVFVDGRRYGSSGPLGRSASAVPANARNTTHADWPVPGHVMGRINSSPEPRRASAFPFWDSNPIMRIVPIYL